MNQELPTSSSLSEDERAELQRLRAEKAVREKAGLSLKVSEKGGVSLYGLGRFPVTLYKEQWEKVLESAPLIQEFLKAHAAELKVKEKKEAGPS